MATLLAAPPLELKEVLAFIPPAADTCPKPTARSGPPAVGSTGRRQLISQIHQREPLVGRRTRIVVAVDQYRSPTDRLIRRAHAQIAIAVGI